MQPRCCRGLHLSPSGHWEPVSKVLQLLCVVSELASIQSFYHTGSLNCCCSCQCKIGRSLGTHETAMKGPHLKGSH